MSARSRIGILAAAAVTLAFQCGPPRPDDAMLTPDLWNVAEGRVLEIVPGAPLVDPGPDEELGTADDLVDPRIVGDVDLVARIGPLSDGDAFTSGKLLATAPEIVVAPFGAGAALDVEIGAASSASYPALGAPTAAPSLEGVPIVIAAFPDLDGDGYIGVTNLDGDPTDALTEEAELLPTGRQVGFAMDGVAAETLRVRAAGPPGAPLVHVVGGGAWTAELDEGGFLPTGPFVSTRLPFLPVTDPSEVADPGTPIDPINGFSIDIEDRFVPNPADPLQGEAFTIPTDGSSTSNDLFVAISGAPVRFGVVAEPEPGFEPELWRPLRPAIGDAGERILVESLERLVLPDDGAASTRTLRVVALDGLGNIAVPDGSASVTLTVAGGLRIVAPDSDGDLSAELVTVTGVEGIEITIDDAGLALDDALEASLVADAGDLPNELPVFLPDPDVDDSGSVDGDDLAAVEDARGVRVGEASFEARLDLDGDGRVTDEDAAIVEASLGLGIAVP